MLERIEDEDVRAMVLHMIARDPKQRFTTTMYLKEWRERIFPTVFYSFLHAYLAHFVGGVPMTPDQKILK